MYSIGLDIGTSNLSVVLIDKDSTIITTKSVKNDSTVKGKHFEALQDPFSIFLTAQTLIDTILQSVDVSTLHGIGISNQMHGIVYVDTTINALSPLYTWQDKRGDEAYNQDYSFSEYVHIHTGFQVPTGYGLLTHFYNIQKKLVPSNTACILDIGSFIAAKLVTSHLHTDSLASTNSNINPNTNHSSLPFLIHTSNAHAWGFFDIVTQNFNQNALHTLGIDTAIIPSICNDPMPVGAYKNITVYPALGDNQAGVLGSIGTNTEAVLINIGTSAQLSFIDSSIPLFSDTHTWEMRPFIQDTILYVASSLCGGKTLDIWTYFIAHAIHTIQDSTDTIENIQKTVYTFLSSLSHNTQEKEHQKIKTDLTVTPYFYGTRNTPKARAAITDISPDNFNIHTMSKAMMQGITDELLAFWNKVPPSIQNNKHKLFLTGKSTTIPFLQQQLKKAFSPLQLCLLASTEYSAIGAAMWTQ